MSDHEPGPGVLRSYRIVRELGAGGMGSVYEGRMLLPLGKELPVAIKLMHRDPLAGAAPGGDRRELDPVARRRAEMFAREALTSMHLGNDHPNLVTAYDFGVSSTGRLFLVLELVHGASLADLAERCPVPAPVLRRVARDTLAGLAHLHRSGVIHGDVSPGNILISRRGVVKLADLGLCRRVDGTVSDTFRGTAAYASPEALQCAGVDATSDLYSLAAVLYEVVAGHPPHGADGGPAAIFGHMVAQIQAPVPAGAPADLAALIAGLLRFHSGERDPATARDAMALLDRGDQPVADDDELCEFVRRAEDAGAASRDTGMAFADTVVTLRPLGCAEKVPRTAERVPRTAEQGEAGPVPERRSVSQAMSSSPPASRTALRAWFLALAIVAVMALAYPVLSRLAPAATAADGPAQLSSPPNRLAGSAITEVATEATAAALPEATPEATTPGGTPAATVDTVHGTEARASSLHSETGGAGAARAPVSSRQAQPNHRPRVRRRSGAPSQEPHTASDHFRPLSTGPGIHIVTPPQGAP